MREWGLQRSEDVWRALMMEAFTGKRIKSRFRKEIMQAWRSMKPDLRTPPSSKQQILEQPLFDNPSVRNAEGATLTAKKGPGNFGYKWVQRGVSTVRDIWNEDSNQWRSPAELKGKLGQLPDQEQKAESIRAALPQEWKHRLGPYGVNPPGTWFHAEAPEYHRFYRLEEWDAEVQGKCVLEVFEKESRESSKLVSFGTVVRYGLSGLSECRIILSEDKKQTPMTVGGGRDYSKLRIDPEAWGWAGVDENTIGLRKLGKNMCRVGRKERKSVEEKLTSRWERTIHNIPPPKKEELNNLWEQLKIIPSQKLASLLWLQSHLAVPTAMWLRNRGMEALDPKCVRCGWLFEEAKHMWWDCPKSQKWWKWWLFSWKEITGRNKFTDERWVLSGAVPDEYKSKEGWGYMAQVTRAIMLGLIWKDRNMKRFDNKELADGQAYQLFKYLLANEIRADWQRTRKKKGKGKGVNWFLKTWALGSCFATVTLEGRMVLSQWL
ncbi:hypothetical protein CBR_g75808, partial [Chara braunii]